MESLSMSLAMTIARSQKLHSRTNSLCLPRNSLAKPDSAALSRGLSLYGGVSDRPLGWKPKRPKRNATLSSARDISVRTWDGAARQSRDWDGLRRDPELWYPNGNCLVYLYGQGQSRRGPAFKVPMDHLLAKNCQGLLQRFMIQIPTESPISEERYFDQQSTETYHLFIPPPPGVDREASFLYHVATRNFFAWIFGKSLVGTHLGGALVGLLNSMNEFRAYGEDNIEAIMDYMDEESYADMRNYPDHALAILFFAEHFQFRDLWIDAFAHCAGMNERLISSPGFEFMSRKSRALVTRSRLEMDVRLENAGGQLRSFLSDELSEIHLGLSSGARAHLDKFRTFLHSYFVAKLGYYPPASPDGWSAAFPKNVYGQMCKEFQALYDFLVDSTGSSSDAVPMSQQGGICVLQTLQSFDQRQKYPPLAHQLPLLPEDEDCQSTKRISLNNRLSFLVKSDKMKLDPRLVALSSLEKATNRSGALMERTLIRAYRGFEKDCIFSNARINKSEKISQTDARKVRWILVYTTLQTLKSVSAAPEEVRDVQNIGYNICVLTAGCPPWKDERPIETLLQSQTVQSKEDFKASIKKTTETKVYQPEIKPDIDHLSISRGMSSKHSRGVSDPSPISTLSRKPTVSTVRKALSTLGNMPELRHPAPRRVSYHEILVQGYGNGTNVVNIATEPTLADQVQASRKSSTDSESSLENSPSRWSRSNSSAEEGDAESRTTSPSQSRRGSDISPTLKQSTNEILEQPLDESSIVMAPSAYSASDYDEACLQPDPLQLKRNQQEECIVVSTEMKSEWDAKNNMEVDAVLSAYFED